MPLSRVRAILKWAYLSILFVAGIVMAFVLSYDQPLSPDVLRQNLISADSIKVIEPLNSKFDRYLIHQHTDVTAPILILMHGAPGNCLALQSYMLDSTLQSTYTIISYDRIGYGLIESLTYRDINTQAQDIIDLINEIDGHDRSVFLLSHSYGGPVGVVASTMNSKIKGHVMLAPVVDPASEPVFIISPIPITWPFRLIASQSMKYAAIEKVNHQDDLTQVNNYLYTRPVTTPTILIHGEQDWLAPPENIDVVKDLVSPDVLESIILSESSHFIPWTEFDIVKSELLKIAN